MNANMPGIQGRGLSVAITGSGGSGAVTAGLILLEAAAKTGLYGLMMRSAGPQIRGGESASLLRFGDAPVACMDDRFDLLLGLDWRNAGRFEQEIPLDASSLILTDPAVGSVPESFSVSGARVRQLAFKERATRVNGGRLNMVATGTAGALCGLPRETIDAAVHKILADKGTAVVDSAIACVALGYELAALPKVPAPSAPEESAARWRISGNQACGLGALRGGVRFVAAYPITPASEMLEWLAPRLERLGGSLLQAEDELASINMIVGASYGGVPSLTATSGPGLSLMLEGLGLAVASETPVVVIDVTRAGPSTGIPTKSEQSDLNIALYGMHGEAPHLVLAPLDVRDCVFTTQWAVRLAEHLQTAAIVLSDQSLGQSRAVIAPPTEFKQLLERVTEWSPAHDYRRYAATKDGVSPMTSPGIAHGMYTADGLEHDEQGIPSSMAGDHLRQLGKRQHKIDAFDYGAHWAEIRGGGELCLICWGSSSGAVLEAADRLEADRVSLRVIAMRLLAPLRREALRQALAGAKQVWVVEQNHSGQLYHYLKAHEVLPLETRLLARPGPIPLRPGEIVKAVTVQR
jgi:2-oxoglutarate ferredoxin oxidoreductase subunit alpha